LSAGKLTGRGKSRMNTRRIFAELKRRHVCAVVVADALAAGA
jgi:hypothetical protein